MDTRTEAFEYCIRQVNDYPALADQINSFYSLFRMEISDDEASVENEWELLYSDVEDLIKTYKISTTA